MMFLKRCFAVALSVYSVDAVFVANGSQFSSPPVYPSPKVTGAGGWEAALEKAKLFVGQLTLQEKADMVTGKCSSFTKYGHPAGPIVDSPFQVHQAPVSATSRPSHASISAAYVCTMGP